MKLNLLFTCYAFLLFKASIGQIKTTNQLANGTVYCKDADGNTYASLPAADLFDNRIPKLDVIAAQASMMNTPLTNSEAYGGTSYEGNGQSKYQLKGSDCGNQLSSLLASYEADRHGDDEIRIVNQFCSHKAGWVENSPGICDAGGPPPICPREDHWHKNPNSMKEWYKQQNDIYNNRLADAVAIISNCQLKMNAGAGSSASGGQPNSSSQQQTQLQNASGPATGATATGITPGGYASNTSANTSSSSYWDETRGGGAKSAPAGSQPASGSQAVINQLKNSLQDDPLNNTLIDQLQTMENMKASLPDGNSKQAVNTTYTNRPSAASNSPANNYWNEYSAGAAKPSASQQTINQLNTRLQNMDNNFNQASQAAQKILNDNGVNTDYWSDNSGSQTLNQTLINNLQQMENEKNNLAVAKGKSTAASPSYTYAPPAPATSPALAAPSASTESAINSLGDDINAMHKAIGNRENISLDVADALHTGAMQATTQLGANVFGVASGLAVIGAGIENAVREKEEREREAAERREAIRRENERREQIAERRIAVVNGVQRKWPISSTTGLGNQIYVYFLAWDDQSYDGFNLRISEVQAINRLSDGSWPLVDKIEKQYRAGISAANFKIAGYFKDKTSATLAAQALLGSLKPYEIQGHVSVLTIKQQPKTVNNSTNNASHTPAATNGSGSGKDYWSN